jgi:hypothetical protein
VAARVLIVLFLMTACRPVEPAPSGDDGGRRDSGEALPDGGAPDAGVRPDGGTRPDAGQGDGGTDGGTGDPSELDAFCDRLIVSTCAYRVRCGQSADLARCTEYLSLELHQYDPCLAAERASVIRGTASFDSDRATACLAAMADGGVCQRADPIDGLDACRALVTGSTPVGGSCVSDSDCSPSSSCDSTPRSCPSYCRAKKTAGAVAARPGECAAGLYLYVAPGAPTGTCEVPAARGASCDVLRAGAPLQRCAQGSTCDRYGTKTCIGLVDAGESCTSDDDCPSALRCMGFGCGLPSGLDQSCSLGLNGVLVPCLPELYCVAVPPTLPGQCVPRVDANQPCSMDWDCKPGLWCDHPGGVAGSCAPQRGVGDACELFADDECGDGLFCDFNATHTCLPKKDGGTCDSDYLCAAGFRCDMGTCGPDACR